MSEEREIPVSGPEPKESPSQSKKTTEPGNEGEPNNTKHPSGDKMSTQTQSTETTTEEELEGLRKEKEEIYDLFLRKQAEVENFKKRLERDKTESIRYANESLISELLPVIDNFELAISAVYNKDNEEETRSHNEGVKLILKQLKDVLAKYDLTDVPTIGHPFDPDHHEAVLQKASDEHPPNTVVEEHRKGYKLKGKLVRPAMVVVSKKEEEKALSETDEGSND